jgi:hypothetical protein
MTADSRAYAWCNLGPLATEGAQIAADHASRAGVIKYRGTVSLAGIYRPNPGAIIELAYSDGQAWMARLPLRLRVLSSFCNPLSLSPVTTVSVGCDLAYFEDRKQPPTKITARDLNSEVPEAVWRAAAPAIPANAIVQRILAGLNLSVAGEIPLTNQYTRKEFDLTGGYIEELDKLCSSEQYMARMNAAGQVEFIYKSPQIISGPILTEEDLIDLNPINSGDLPGEAVYAKYSRKILNPPTNDPLEQEKRNWEREDSSSAETYTHNWTEYLKTDTGETKPRRDAYGYILYDPLQEPGTETLTEEEQTQQPLTEPVYEVKAFQRQEEINFVNSSISVTTYDKKDRVTSRKTTTVDQWGESRSETYYTYQDGFVGSVGPASLQNEEDYGEVTKELTLEFAPLGSLRLSLGAQLPYYQLRQAGSYQTLAREIIYDKDDVTGITRTITKTSVPFIETQDGSEAISRLRERRQPWESVDDLVATASRLVAQPIQERIRTERMFGHQYRPSEVDRTTSANQKAPTVEDYAETVWAIGSATSQTSVELSPPYTSDDSIRRTGNQWQLIPSDAPRKALFYAQNENRILLGYRNGNGIQTLPELIPPEPLGIFFIRLKGCTAAFLVDGHTWNIGPEGATVTCDALFWGAVDGAVSNTWFPLPSGASSLPAAAQVTTNANPKPDNAISIPQGFNFNNPNLTALFSSLPTTQSPVYAKTINPAYIIPPYSETLSAILGTGAGVLAEIQDFRPSPPIAAILGMGAGMLCTQADVYKTILSMGAGMFCTISEESPLQTILGMGAGMLSAITDVTPNFIVNWTLTFYVYLNSGGNQTITPSATPTYSSTQTTATVSFALSIPNGANFLYGELRIFDNDNPVVISDAPADTTITVLQNNTPAPGLVFVEYIDPFYAVYINSDDSLTGPCTLAISVTVTKSEYQYPG